jgi:CubicO group peptidase (beta-lactamase class C family)
MIESELNRVGEVRLASVLRGTEPRRRRRSLLQRRSITVASVITLLVYARCPVSAQTQVELPKDLDAYVARALATFKVPGVSIAVVKDGKVILAKGYGVRRLGENTPVDAQTIFAIGSNTKAFTAAALAILVDEKKVAWDAPVTKYLPGFQMFDPYVTREITVRDLLAHRSGLGNGLGELLYWPGTDYTREEIIGKLRLLKPTRSFRSRYAYDNMSYLVAGQIVPAVAGESWDSFVQSRIFTPLGMKRTGVDIELLRTGSNAASGHSTINDTVVAIAARNLGNVGPAGAINSTAEDMARWLVVQLDRGKLTRLTGANADLYSAARSREMWSANTVMPFGEPPPALSALRTNFAAYGLGWNLREYRGRLWVTHSGSVPGYVSQVSLIPDLALGIVILTNQENGALVATLGDYLLDGFMNVPRTDWVSVFDELIKKGNADAKPTAKARPAPSVPSLPLQGYAKRYSDAWRDDVTITLENGKLVLRFSHTDALVGDLEHWQHDTFLVRWRDRALAGNSDAYATFTLKPDGTIDRMTMTQTSDDGDQSLDFDDLLFKPVQ